MKPKLTLVALKAEAGAFATLESAHREPALFGVTDGKAVGTYFEHKFREHLRARFDFQEGSSAKGIDFPELDVDMKVTSIKQPQSSCPYKSARQKIYGLGYSVLVFVYDKTDDPASSTVRLYVQHVIFFEKERTADFQTTTGIRNILDNQGNKDDLLAFIAEHGRHSDTPANGNSPRRNCFTNFGQRVSALRAGCVVSRSGQVAHEGRGMPDPIRG